MKTTPAVLALAVLMAASFASGNAGANAEEQEYWDAARRASCPELIAAYKETSDAERKVVAAIKESRNGTVATNVLGVTSLAILGIGFFTWDDNASAEENLADLRYDLKLITAVAREKRCQLPLVQSEKK